MVKTKNVALILGLASAYDRALARGMAHFVRDEGLPWVFEFVPPTTQAIDGLRRRKPDGIIAFLIDEKLDTLDKIGYADAGEVASLGRPTVNVADKLQTWDPPRVNCDHHAIGRMAAEHFLERAFRHFAFVGWPGRQYSDDREEGFITRVKEAGYSCARPSLQVQLSSRSSGQWRAAAGHLRRWLRALPKPTAIMASNDGLAWNIAQICHHAGVSVPDEIALIGVDNDEVWCNLAYPPLSSVLTSPERMGYQSAAMLARLFTGRRITNSPLLLPPTGIVTRTSSDVLAIDDADVVQAIRFIRERAAQPLSVDDVVNALPLTRRSLERRFHSVLGRSPAEEIRRMHVERAKTLLATSDLAIPAIAARSGFPNANRLYAVFSREVGVPPTEYRRQVAIGK